MAAVTTAFRFHLDLRSGVPVYRQIIDQVLVAIASGTLNSGDQLPTVRQLAVELSINPNTVVRAYKELEIRGVLTTQQGTGTFITQKKVKVEEAQRQRRLAQMAAEFIARVAAEGYTTEDIQNVLADIVAEQKKKRS